MHVSYRYLLIIVLVAALLCLMPARGADARRKEAADRGRAERRKRRSARGGGLIRPNEQGDVSAPHAVLRALRPQRSAAGKTAAQLVGLTRGVLEKEIGGLYENAAVTGFSAGEVDITTRMDMPCPLHWVLRGGEDGCWLSGRIRQAKR